MKRTFDAKIRKVGNSYVVTVPSSLVKRFKLKEEFIKVDVDIDD